MLSLKLNDYVSFSLDIASVVVIN